MTQHAAIDITGPYELREVALMGFGHRDETSFDGAMRMAFCLDGDYERQVGVVARQVDARLELAIETVGSALDEWEMARACRHVARVVSLDHDGAAFHRLCQGDPVLARVHEIAPGFRPALFYSPYEAVVWSLLSARRPRAQGITLRNRLAEQHSTGFDLARQRLHALPTPSRMLAVESVPGLPADRIPRLHAAAEAARRGDLDADRLRSLDPQDAMAELQRLPGIGPFYSALVVIRACGHADVPAPEEGRSREAIRELYGLDHELSDAELAQISETWRPFRTWATVMIRALSGRMPASVG